MHLRFLVARYGLRWKGKKQQHRSVQEGVSVCPQSGPPPRQPSRAGSAGYTAAAAAERGGRVSRQEVAKLLSEVACVSQNN